MDIITFAEQYLKENKIPFQLTGQRKMYLLASVSSVDDVETEWCFYWRRQIGVTLLDIIIEEYKKWKDN